MLLARLTKVKMGQIALSVLSTGGFLTVLLGLGSYGSMIGGAFSTLLLALNLYTRNYNLGEQAQQHRDTANKIWYLREKYLSLITDLAMGCESLLDARLRRDTLTEQLKEVYASAPSTTDAAYKKARKALSLEEEMTFSAAEVDAFLPQALRRTEQFRRTLQ